MIERSETSNGIRVRARILELVAEFEARGAIPSVRQLADAVPLGVSTVHHHLQVLLERGQLEQVQIGDTGRPMYRRSQL